MATTRGTGTVGHHWGPHLTRSDPLEPDNAPHSEDWLQPGAASTAPVDGSASPAAPALPPRPPEPVAVPLTWLVDCGPAPIRYRAITELARVSPLPHRLLSLVYGFPPAVALALSQRPDGTWYNAMLAVPALRGAGAAFEGVGTIVAYRRLLEYGWDRDAPPLFHTRRLLFRLITEDNDPSLLFELGDKAKSGDDAVRRNRILLREAAAAALAQAGYEGDPRLRGVAQRLIHRVITFIRSPLASDPWVTVGGGGKRVLAPNAAPPSYFFLLMLAYMPLFRLEHASETADLLKYLTRASSNGEHGASGQPASQRQFLTGDPLNSDEDAAGGDIGFTVAWLELVARLGYLKRHEGWSQTFDRLLEQCDEACVWRARRGQGASRVAHPFVWPSYPLVPSGASDDQAAEMSFRLSLIARLSGRPLEFV